MRVPSTHPGEYYVLVILVRGHEGALSLTLTCSCRHTHAPAWGRARRRILEASAYPRTYSPYPGVQPPPPRPPCYFSSPWVGATGKFLFLNPGINPTSGFWNFRASWHLRSPYSSNAPLSWSLDFTCGPP